MLPEEREENKMLGNFHSGGPRYYNICSVHDFGSADVGLGKFRVPGGTIAAASNPRCRSRNISLETAAGASGLRHRYDEELLDGISRPTSQHFVCHMRIVALIALASTRTNDLRVAVLQVCAVKETAVDHSKPIDSIDSIPNILRASPRLCTNRSNIGGDGELPTKSRD
jgi:hypothetical protein